MQHYKTEDQVHWRVINLSFVPHAMHLHGMYFNVDVAGDISAQQQFVDSQRRKVATQLIGKPFKPGQSGNPRGRPEGSRHATTLAVERLLEGEAEEIGRKAVELAKSGDTVALRLCLERIAPVRKGRPISLTLPSISTSADVTTALSAIVAQMAAGEITPDEAAVAASVIETKRKALETEQLDRRLRAIEEQLSAKGK